MTDNFTTELLPDYEVILHKHDQEFLDALEKSGELIGYTVNGYPVVLKGTIQNMKCRKTRTSDLNHKGLLETLAK